MAALNFTPIAVEAYPTGCTIDIGHLIDAAACPKVDIVMHGRPYAIDSYPDYVCVTPSYPTEAPKPEATVYHEAAPEPSPMDVYVPYEKRQGGYYPPGPPPRPEPPHPAPAPYPAPYPHPTVPDAYPVAPHPVSPVYYAPYCDANYADIWVDYVQWYDNGMLNVTYSELSLYFHLTNVTSDQIVAIFNALNGNTGGDGGDLPDVPGEIIDDGSGPIGDIGDDLGDIGDEIIGGGDAGGDILDDGGFLSDGDLLAGGGGIIKKRQAGYYAPAPAEHHAHPAPVAPTYYAPPAPAAYPAAPYSVSRRGGSVLPRVYPGAAPAPAPYQPRHCEYRPMCGHQFRHGYTNSCQASSYTDCLQRCEAQAIQSSCGAGVLKTCALATYDSSIGFCQFVLVEEREMHSYYEHSTHWDVDFEEHSTSDCFAHPSFYQRYY